MPSAITVKSKTEDSVAISWEAPKGGGSAYDKVAEYFIFCASVVGNQNCSKTASNNSVMLDTLISNTKYAIQVAARNTENGPNGEFSEIEHSVTRKCAFSTSFFVLLLEQANIFSFEQIKFTLHPENF